ncbi:MAG TPA: hypothetical protein VEI07_18665, partial [Planctomycetaceae bacterium]|nr:hypothetical protein [Planctomycetaceae bacterium]
YELVCTNSTNGNNIKSSAGTVYSITAFNNGTSPYYLKLYNTSSSPTVGTSTVVACYGIPAGGGNNIPIPPQGLNFSTGISIACTGGIANSDTTTIPASTVVITVAYA